LAVGLVAALVTVVVAPDQDARLAFAAPPGELSVAQLGADIDGETSGDFSGASVALSADGNTVIVGAPYNAGNGTDSGQARVFTWDGSVWNQSGADIDGEAANDYSGWSVALSADGNTAIVGAPNNDGNGTDSGQARVFTWDGSAWNQRGADIDGEAANDFFGWSVALSADGNTAIVGAPENASNGNASGQVRIFTWDGIAWTQLGADIDGEAANDYSGWSVALSEDGNTAIVGAPNNNGNGDDSGQARIFTWDGIAWTQLGADIDGEAIDDLSGSSVALSADGSTAIVGAPNNAGDSGQARLFAWDGIAWTQLGADIDGEAAGDFFGWSVALSADGSTAIVGAPNNAGGSGQARLFAWDGSAWTQRGADIDGEVAGDNSGRSVALSADGNTAIIGAPSPASTAGHARVVVSLVMPQKGADIDGEAAGDFSGWSVALSADGNTAIVGAPFNVSANASGQARVFTWDGNAWTQRGADIDGEAAGDFSGWSVALSADGNTAIVGAPHNAGNGINSGHARIFAWDGSTWTQRGADINGEAAGDQSGYRVGLSADGSTAIIGAPFNNGAANDTGHARVHTWNGSAWTQLGADINGEAANDYSGSVGLSADGNTAIIGAAYNDGNGTASGHARVYTWNGSAWTQLGADIDGEAAIDLFGTSVALSADGNTAIIGAPNNDSNGADAGHARIFTWDGGAWAQRGADINGDVANDQAGHAVALSADGNTAIIGEPYSAGANRIESGQARIFTWNGSAWTQRGADIDGEATFDYSGWSVGLSADGNTAIVSAANNDGNGDDSGHARIYTWSWVRTPAMANPAVAAAPQTETAVVSWTPGLAYSYGPVTGWTIEQSADGGVSWLPSAPTATPAPGDTTATLNGLSNGTEYLFRVAGVNTVGTGPFAVSNPVTPLAPPATVFVPLTPTRVLDTRAGAKVGNAAGTGTPLTLSLFGKGGLPSGGIDAVALNVTVVEGDNPTIGGGYVTVYPCGTRPDASNVNFTTGQTVSNSLIAELSASGTVCFYVYGSAHLLVDVSGYFPVGSEYMPLTATRILNTRSGATVGNAAGTGAPFVLQVSGQGGVPLSGVGAVALNVAVTQTDSPTIGGGYVTVYPCGTRPDASNLNFTTGQTIANSVIAPLSAAGTVCFYVYGVAHLLVDVSGYFPT